MGTRSQQRKAACRLGSVARHLGAGGDRHPPRGAPAAPPCYAGAGAADAFVFLSP